MEITNSNATDNILTEATIVNDGQNTQEVPKVQPIDFKAFAQQLLQQCSQLGQLTWTEPDPSKIDKKLVINMVRLLESGEKQKLRLTIENPDELIF
jgi:hypothetical protein